MMLISLEIKTKHGIHETATNKALNDELDRLNEEMEQSIDYPDSTIGITTEMAWGNIKDRCLNEIHQLILQTTEVIYDGVMNRRDTLQRIKKNTARANNNPRPSGASLLKRP